MHVQIDYQLKLLSPLHIGSGLGGGGIKRMMLKDQRGKLSIPGSTIKGRVRHYCTELLQSWPKAPFTQDDLQAVFGTEGDTSRGRTLCAFSDIRKSPEVTEHRFVRNGVQISRQLGIAKPHALFNTEYAEIEEQVPQARLDGQVIYQHHDDNERHIALIIVGLLLLRRLGGSKTSGAGECQIPISSIGMSRDGNQQPNIDQWIMPFLEEV